MIGFRGWSSRVRERSGGAVDGSWLGKLAPVTGWLETFGLSTRGAAIGLFIGIGVSIVGPYGTSVLPFGVRALYWCGMILTAGLTWAVTFKLLSRRKTLGRWPLWVRLVLANAVMAWSGSILTVLIRNAMGAGLPGSFLENVATVFVPFFAIACFAVTPVIAIVFRSFAAEKKDLPTEDDASAALAFLNRLPEEMRGDILYVKAEDHYLRVFTERGNTLILMRLRDAMAELGDTMGLQVHRSYWVSRRAVLRTERAGRELRLVLWNGDEVPVSRAFKDEAVEVFGPPKK